MQVLGSSGELGQAGHLGTCCCQLICTRWHTAHKGVQGTHQDSTMQHNSLLSHLSEMASRKAHVLLHACSKQHSQECTKQQQLLVHISKVLSAHTTGSRAHL
jgi:hypothetical protein